MYQQETYLLAYWGLFFILLTLLLQGIIASAVKGAATGAIPGKIDESLGHASFIFRSHRTFMNSLENMPAILGASLLAILVGANSYWTGLLIAIIAFARVVHMILYYLIATDKNPSPRSYFFVLGFSATIGLLVLSAMALSR